MPVNADLHQRFTHDARRANRARYATTNELVEVRSPFAISALLFELADRETLMGARVDDSYQ